ncbi:MAG: hypothetical protein KIT48_08085 [Pseudolabrys sp.]|nr:hypothetical protein [Pseudolabrys sp.]
MKKRTGLFLGAGASYEAGMPLVTELTDEIKDWLTPEKLRALNAGWLAQGNGVPDAVIEDFISVLVRPDMHYEALLGYVEAQFRRSREFRQDYHGFYSWLVSLVYHLLYVRQVSNDVFFNRRLPAYDGLKALADANDPLWVFSLNHDVIIEAIAARLSIPLHTGFSSTIETFNRRDASGKTIGELQGQVLTKDTLEKHAMNFPNPPQPGIYLLKIHGALDIFTFNDGKDLLKLLATGPGQEGVFDALRAANEGLFYEIPGAPGARAKAMNEICNPDKDGVLQFLRRSLLAGAHKFDERGHQVLPQSMLKHFRSNLNFVTHLVCIGYGFGDLHINLALREWLEFTSERSIEIVSPGARDIPSFLLHLSPQVKLTAQTATDYLDSYAGIKRSRIENLEKRANGMLRALGKKRAKKKMAAYHAAERERAGRALLAKLQSLPLKDGKPDVSSIGDPIETAKRWAAEVRMSPEEAIERMIDFLDKDKSS